MLKSKYKILVVGAGSIGTRHLKNLQALGVKQLGAVESNPQKRKELGEGPSFLKLGKARPSVFNGIQAALKEKWHAVFICSPPSTHLKIALEIAKRRIPMFIEKPISHNLQGLVQLQRAAKNIKPIMTGYNIDFHPQFQKIQAILKKKTFF